MKSLSSSTFVLLLFPILFTLVQPAAYSQVAHAGPWTAYLDGNGIRNMSIRDSFMCISTCNGIAFVNANTRQTQFFWDFGNPDMPGYGDYAIDPSGQLWTFHNDQLVRIQQNGAMQIMGPKPLYQVNVLKVDRAGQLWVGMVTEPVNNPAVSTCLAKFNGSGWDYVSIGVTRLNVLDLAFDELNRPVATTRSVYSTAGLYRYNGTAFVHIPGIIHEHVAVSSDGKIATAGSGYVGTFLKLYQNGAWTSYGQSGQNDEKEFAYPVFDADNNLWSVNERAKVFRVNSAGIVQTLSPPVNFQSEPSADIVSGMAFDDKGRLWLAVHSGLFCAPDPNVDVWEYVQTAPMEFPRNAGVFGYNDTILLWINAGIRRVVQEKSEKIDWPGLVPSGYFYDNYRKGLWAITGSVMTLYRPNDTTAVDLAPMFPEPFYNTIRSVAQDSTGNLWITNTRTVIKYTPGGQWLKFDVGPTLPPYNIRWTALSGKDDMWVLLEGTHIDPMIQQPGGKLVKISGNTITEANLPYSFLQRTSSFAAISDTDIWFSIANDTIVHMQNNLTTKYTYKDIGGSLNAQRVVKYNDATILLFSNSGLYIFYKNKWYVPKVPSNRFSNSSAYRYQISNNGKIYLDGCAAVVLEDMQQLLADLTSSVDTPPVDPESPHYTVYPNPTTGLLNVERFTGQCPDCPLRLIGLEGRLVARHSAPVQSPVDLSNLPNGVYILNLWSPEKGGRNVKVVKMRAP